MPRLFNWKVSQHSSRDYHKTISALVTLRPVNLFLLVKTMCYFGTAFLTLTIAFCFISLKGEGSSVVMAQQHRDWAKLGFIRGIAVSPVICCSLSTPQWVTLLLRVVRGSLPDEETLLPPASTANLPRQVKTRVFVEVFS